MSTPLSSVKQRSPIDKVAASVRLLPTAGTLLLLSPLGSACISCIDSNQQRTLWAKACRAEERGMRPENLIRKTTASAYHFVFFLFFCTHTCARARAPEKMRGGVLGYNGGVGEVSSPEICDGVVSGEWSGSHFRGCSTAAALIPICYPSSFRGTPSSYTLYLKCITSA